MTDPKIVAEVRRLLVEAGWTMRKMRAQGIGSRPAEALLGKNDSTPSVDSMERALSLLQPPRRLWHGKA